MRMNKFADAFSKLLLTTALSSAAIGGGSAALAQASPPADQGAHPDDGASLSEIVVTAQKRSENLQNVPVSVSAVGAAQLASSGIARAEDIQIAVPGIAVYRGNSATQFYIRGIGTVGAAAGQEAATATFVDGVYMPSMSGSSLALNNIQRIEVLKGPQGTLYGRNATAGAVNIVTLTPSTKTALRGELGYGNFDQIEGSVYGTTGLTQDVAIDVAARYYNQGDGFGRNTTLGIDANKRRETAVRSKIFGDFGETKITGAIDYSRENGDIGVDYRQLPSGVNVLGRKGWPGGFYDIEASNRPYVRVENKGVSLKIEQNVGSLAVTSITAYRDVKQNSLVDFDTTALPLVYVTQREKNNQFTQELQIASKDDPDFTWIAGLFYLDSMSEYKPFRVEGLGLAPFARSDINARQDTKSYAAYGQATRALWKDGRLTVGLRYTIDQRRLTADSSLVDSSGGVVPVIPDLRDKVTFKKPQWRFALDQKVGGQLVYASYSRGIKSGVYNLTDPTNEPVRPEQLDAFEVGLKTELFDRRVRLNLAAFNYIYKEIQIVSYQGPKQVLLNAAKAKIYGLDAEFEAAITRDFSIHGGAQYIHARYGDFPGVPVLVPGVAGNDVVSCSDPNNPAAAPSPGFCNGRGKHLSKVPTFSANLSANYRLDLGNAGKLAANVDYAYNSGFYWEPINRIKQSAYSLVNAQLKWSTASEHLYVRIWAKNLLQKKYIAGAFEASVGDIAVAAAPRTYGGSVGFSF